MFGTANPARTVQLAAFVQRFSGTIEWTQPCVYLTPSFCSRCSLLRVRSAKYQAEVVQAMLNSLPPDLVRRFLVSFVTHVEPASIIPR